MEMIYLKIALKLIVALSILNVWLLRSRKATEWRGGSAGNMKEEFANYGLPMWVMPLIGTLKVLLSVALIASIWYEQIESIPAMGIAVLMLGAVFMHIKIGDPIKKSLPATTFLILSALIVFL